MFQWVRNLCSIVLSMSYNYNYWRRAIPALAETKNQQHSQLGLEDHFCCRLLEAAGKKPFQDTLS
jgi:hypothetical protein